MARYRFEPDIVSRGKGQSMIAKAAYNARADIRDERTGEMKHHAQRPGLEWCGIFTPKNAPEWMQDRAQLWNAVERKEDQSKRHDTAQLARSLELNLPHELSAEDRRRLIRDFVREEFVRLGMVADVAIHAPDAEGDQRNYHAHVLLTMREITPEGFGKKVREWDDYLNKELNLKWRDKWADLGARYLRNAGFELEADRYRVDHLTLERQRQAALERGDLAHIETLDERIKSGERYQRKGPQVTAMERRGVQTEIGNAYRDDLQYNLSEAADRAVILDLDQQIENRRAELAATKETERPAPAGLRGTSADIRQSVESSDNAQALAAAFGDKGIVLAMATKDEAEQSRNRAAEAKANGSYAPIYREGEIVAVDQYGHAYRLTQEKTGIDRRDMQRYLRTLDTAQMQGIEATQDRMQRRLELEEEAEFLERAPQGGGMRQQQQFMNRYNDRAQEHMEALSRERDYEDRRRSDQEQRRDSAEKHRQSDYLDQQKQERELFEPPPPESKEERRQPPTVKPSRPTERGREQ